MRRSIAIGGIVTLLIVVGFTVLLATRPPVDGTAIRSPLLGKMAPAFSGPELNGGHFSLAAERGNIVVLTFWASWCTPCKEEAPNLSTFAWNEQHHHVKVIGVVFNDTLASARSFAALYGNLYPSMADPNGSIAFHYGVTAPPSTFVIDPTGRVVASLIGPASVKQLTAVVAQVQG